jgi:hypothetical protein
MEKKQIISRIAKGDVIKASWLNRIVDKARQSIKVGSGLSMSKTSSTILLDTHPNFRFWHGEVRSDAAQPSSDDSRYTVRHAKATNTNGSRSDVVTFASDDWPDSDYHVVTNMPEALDNDSHELREGRKVVVFERFDDSNPSKKQQFMFEAPIGTHRFAWAVQNWSCADTTNAPQGLCRVKAYDHVDGPGTWANSDNELTVYLYTPSDNSNKVCRHPILSSGMTFSYFRANDGNFYTDDPKCWDGRFGDIRIFTGASDDFTDGWQLADGTNGTPDMRGRFVVGFWSDVQATSDNNKDSGDYSDIGETGGIAIHEHGCHAAFDHNHGVTLTCINKCAPTGPPGDDLVCDVSVDSETDSRDLSHDTKDHRPPYYVVAYQVRVDNSVAW